MNWDYLQPVKIRFGKGRVSEVKDLAKEMGIKNGLLVADPDRKSTRLNSSH